MADTVRTQQELLNRMKINVAGVQVGRRADINVQTFRDFVVSIPTLGAPGLSNIVEDLTPQLGGDLDLNAFNIVASNAGGPEILDLASSGSVATVRPNRGTVAGLGGSGGAIDIITGSGLSGLRVGTGPGQVNTILQPLGTSGLFAGSVSGSFALHNVAASATVPTLLPDFLSELAGIGANVAGSVSLITASLERLRIDSTGLITMFADLNTNNFRIRFNTGRGINDQNGNEQLTFTQSAGAVNQFTIQNAATGLNPRFIVGGGDPNIGMEIETKSAGELRLQPGNVDAIRMNNTPAIAFFGIAPVAQPTGVAVTAAAIHAALVTLGLITA